MSPSPEYDTYLSLSFPSLAAFLASEAHLSVVSSAARRSNSLLVSVKTTSSSTSTCSSSSASSSSSSRAPPAADTYADADAAPSSLWLPLERALASIYSCATREFLHSSRVLARVDVVVDHVRQLALCPPRTSPDIITWDASEASAAPATSPRPRPEAPDRIARHRDSYEVVALGGTFDHLHAGHKILLTMACSIATRKIIVGVSDDQLLGKKQFRQHLESISARIERVRAFIELIRPTIEHQVVPLEDVYGPTATDPDIQALVVSEETRAGGDAINKLRSERSLSTLDTFVINLVSDDGSTPTTELDDANSVKVAVETKMGSTGIREWIEKQLESTRERQGEPGGGPESRVAA
ncbi:hypothetical protein JCM11491_005025 [Sporobolomyces phaffii]